MSRNRPLAGSSSVRSQREEADPLPETSPTFHDRFVELFEAQVPRLHRVLSRLSGEPDLAADLVQEAFVRLYRRGSFPDSPEAWLISVAMNLFRNEKTGRSRRLRLLTPLRGEELQPPASADPETAASVAESRQLVRRALDRLAERERRMLVLQAEGYHYRDIAAALGLNEKSVGVLLARARRAFRTAYEEHDASR